MSVAHSISIGVMGAAGDILNESEKDRLSDLAERLGRAIADSKCVLVTGATTGIPYMVSRAARAHGGVTIGVSPAMNEKEHSERYRLPLDSIDVVIYTGFGLKGRNVINIRSSDIVIIFGGGMGTLNEFTIAYDEGKVIGVLEGSGGIADHMQEIIEFARKPSLARVIYCDDPQDLLEECLRTYSHRESQ